MSQIMKCFTGIFIILFMTVSSIGILSAFLTVISAQNLHASIINELENSDFYEEVVRESFAKAEETKNVLVLTFYYSDNTSIEVTSEELDKYKAENVEMAKVDLRFNLNSGLFSLSDEHILSGYAR